ncbi:LamG-like jellyroll fold domain-containing protein, partial [Candidatus Albibeggiatoa sp. nov. BB20]|uniref:LamG-like jellyroll fold domain-containing protein n=1 Tax=Candidatus Albibeggiatoa sp. nov. BB20 TaxID=3162723 RepID=UPI00336544FC
SYSAGDNLNQGLLYLDGIALTTIANAGAGGTEGTIPPNTQTGNAYIGSTDPSTHLFTGQIDEVRLWNTARSQAEIQANMYTPLTGSETGLVNYWDFEEANSNKVEDKVSNNNGILTNMDTNADWVDGVIGSPNFVASVSSVLNDILPAYDGDSDGLTFSLVDDDGGATVITDANSGAFTYTSSISGSRTFSYKVNDGTSDSNTVTVNVEIMPNIAPVAGQGTALDFAGGSKYISLDTLTGEVLSDNARTFEAWIKTTATDVSSVFKYGVDTTYNRVRLSTRDGIVRVDLYAKITEWSAPNINDGNWHHIAWSYTAGSKSSESSVYVDGEALTSILSSASNDYPDTQSGIAYIGAHTETSSADFEGQIDEVRLWNTARSQAEIQANMYSALTGSETGLVSYWNFEEATGTTANDLNTSNANHGTLTNMDDTAWVDGIIGKPTFSTSLSTVISDTLPAYDSDGSTLTYSLVSDDGGAAVLSNASTGAFTYTPTTSGTHTFTYKVNDGTVDSNIATVTVEVEPNEPPIAGLGTALNFDGVDDYVVASVATTAIDNITLETWAYWSGNTGDPLIFYNGNSSSSGYGLLINSSSSELKLLCGGIGFATSNYIYPTNEWHHIALVRNTGVWSLYIDGEIYTFTGSCSPNGISDGGLSIAANHSGLQHFEGKIDDVRVWDIARTQAEIQANMYTPLTGSETGLVSYWNFEEATGTTANDLNSSNANHGTLTNMDDTAWIDGIIGEPTFSTSLNTPISDILSAYDSDGGTLTYSFVNDDGGAAVLTDASTGAFTYTPATSGTHTFTYKANDEFDDSNVATVTVEVEPNIAPVAGFGSALNFDGVDDYVEVSNVPYVQISSGTNATFELWLKTTTTIDSFLLSKSPDWISASTTEFALAIMNGGQLRFNGEYSTANINDGQLHHVAVVLNGLSGTYYIDGELDSTFTLSANTEHVISLLIGARRKTTSSDIGNFFTGYMDDVRIWDTARTQAEIQANMYQALQGNETGLIGYWPLDKNTGTTITDLTGNATDGTFISAPIWTDSAVLAWETSLNLPITDTLPAHDTDGGTLTYSLVDNDAGAAVITNASTGAVTYTPVSAGTHTFSYKANDGFDDSNIEIVNVTVSSLIVDNITDVDDGDYATGQNTLREAITNANAGDTITFDPSIAGQTILLDAVLAIDKNLSIDGDVNLISISGQDTVQIFNISAGTVILSNLTLKNGYASAGGAIEISGSNTHVTAQDIIFDSNHATNRGGAVRVVGAGNTVIVKRSTFANNSASTSAGGLRCTIGATAKVYNSTFFNNNSTKGAAINTDNCNLFEIYNSTLHGNTGSHTLQNYTGTSIFKLYNSIISGTVGGVDCSGGLSIQTNTLIQDGTCTASITGDPKLNTTLADNEGTTQSLALSSDSPAVNTGDQATCEALDQRGVSRTAYGTCDIGAYELILIPTEPSNLIPTVPTFDNLASGVVLSWTDSLYEDEYILSRDGSEITTLAQDTISYTDTAITCGSSYIYSLKAKNSSGESNTVSTTSTAMPACPEPVTPTDFIASIPSFGDLDPEIGLSWTDNNDYEDSYILSRGGSVIATLNPNSSSYTDNSVNCDSTYNYSLKASNGFGESGNVSVTAVMPACPLYAPNEPLNFAATALSYNQIQLTWTDSSSLESGYKILRDGNLIDTLDSDTETYTDENLNCNTTYNYEIYAYNSTGDSTVQTVSVTTQVCPSLVPGNLSVIVTADSITLVWEDVEGETGYLVTRESLTTRRIRAITEFDLSADSTTFSDSGFECSQSYDYAVAAVTDTGVSEAATITVEAEACASAPIAPSQLNASAITYATISLTWSDNSDDETKFNISRNGSLAKEVTENSESATIRDLECETTYSFQVTAFNAEGQASSETITATTDTCPLVNLVAPSHFVATTQASNQIQLTWSDNSLNETGFPIARDGVFVSIAPINDEYYLDTTLNCGTEYIYHLYVTDNVINLGGLEEIITTPACPLDGKFYLHLNTIGSGIINNCNDTLCSLNVTANQTVNLSVTPNEGWQFSHWTGDCTESQVLVDAEKNCLAYFSQIPEIEIEPELIPEQPQPVNPLDPTTPTGAAPVPNIGADLCGTSFTNHNSMTGNLNICETGSVSGGNLIGDNVNAGLVSNFTLNQNATITGGRLSGFNTNLGTLQDLTITQYTEVAGGFYAGSVDNNGTMIDPYIEAGSTIYSSTGLGSITGITQNKGTIQGVLKLGVNTAVIGGKISGTIIAPAKSPAYIGAAEILPGAVLQNVYLSPTVKLPRDVTLINVKQASNPAEPSLDDFGVNMEQLDDLDARSIVAVEPAALGLFDRYEVASIPTEAFAGMTPEQIAAFKPETLSNVSVEQFEQISLDSLAGFTADNIAGLNPLVMGTLTVEQLEAFNPESIQQAEQLSKLLTNISPDTPTEVIYKIIPAGWEISATGKIIPPVGTKLGFKGVLNTLPSSILTPYLVDFQSSFSIGGEVVADGNNSDSTVGGGFNIGLQQTPNLDSVDLDQFIFTQNEYGIFNVVGTGDYEGIVFAFMPNANNIEQAPLDTPVGLTTVEGGYFKIVTPDKQEFVLINAPNNPVGLQQALGGESTVKLSPTGDVLMRLDNNNTRSRNLRFETDVMMVGVFDAFVEPASDGFCADAEFCDFGMEFPSNFGNLRARQEAKVIYPDGSVQTIYPTVIYPETLANLLEQYDSIPKVLYKSDGTFEVTVLIDGQEQLYALTPDINVPVRTLDAGEKHNPKVSLQGNILSYEVQEGDDLFTFSLNVLAL